MFEATLEKAELLKKILDAVKELVSDANLDCSDDGLKLQAMDNSHVALVSLWLQTQSFSEFRCDRDMTLGMNLGSLQKIIKCANNDDNCKLSANEDADTLNLQFQGKKAARIGEYEMKLMDIDSEQLGIPETDYDAKVRMPSADFAKIMRDLKDLGESVRIEATSEGVKFTAEGEIGSGSVTLKPNAEWDDDDGPKSSKSKKKASKSKVKKEGAGSAKVKKEENGDDSDGGMDEDDEDVKPKIKDESDAEEDDEDEEDGSDDDEENEDSDEDERPKKRKKGSAAAKGKKASKKSSEGEETGRVAIFVTSPVSLNFSIKYLNNFAKSTPLSGEVMLCMSNDVPLLVAYDWEGGSIKFYLAPKIAED